MFAMDGLSLRLLSPMEASGAFARGTAGRGVAVVPVLLVLVVVRVVGAASCVAQPVNSKPASTAAVNPEQVARWRTEKLMRHLLGDQGGRR
jgi:hypothetical protein